MQETISLSASHCYQHFFGTTAATIQAELQFDIRA